MNEENTPVTQEKPKKRRSLWWLNLLMALIFFAGGTLVGLKLSTMPLPYDVMGTLFPETRQTDAAETPAVAEATVTPEPTAAVTTAPTPTATPKSTPTPEPTESAEPAESAEATESAEPAESAEPVESAEPAEAAEPMEEAAAAGLFTPVVSATPAVTEQPEATTAPKESKKPEVTKPPKESAEPETSPEPTAAAVTETPAVSPTPDTEAPALNAGGTIGIDAALDAALKRAKVSESQAEVYGVYKAKDDDITVYVVSFAAKGNEYEYLINAVTGEVEGWRMIRQEKQEAAAETPAATEQPMLSAAEAREIAFKHAGVKASEATRVSTELEQKVSSLVYVIEFRAGGYEYDYKVDAYTGDIRYFEKTK